MGSNSAGFHILGTAFVAREIADVVTLCHADQSPKRGKLKEQKSAPKRKVAKRPAHVMLGRFCKTVENRKLFR